jgi:hypothetical protein
MSAATFARFTLHDPLPRTGIAQVYRAVDSLPSEYPELALKIFPPQFLAAYQANRPYYEREARLLALLNHPGITPISEIDVHNGQLYIAMPYLPGGSLAGRLAEGPLDDEDSLRILDRLAATLDAVHAAGLAHRNLKPANVLFDAAAEPLLSDAGIQRLGELSPGSRSLASAQPIIGSPAFMSPEQALGRPDVDERSDIYSLGALVYAMLGGQPPFSGASPLQVALQQVHVLPPPLTSLRPDLPPAVDQVLAIALAKDPEQRYASAADLAADLLDAFEGRAPQAARPASAAGGNRLPPGSAPTYLGVPAGPAPGSAPTYLSRRAAAPTLVQPAAPRVSFARLLSGLGLAVLVLLALAAGGSALALWGGWLDSTLIDRAAAAVFPAPPTPVPLAALPSATPTATFTASPSPTPTATLTSRPSATLPPSPTPSPTLSPTPTAPVIGGADLLAFLNENDVWVAYLDGSFIDRLTVDGKDTPEKSGLAWTPDGQALTYASGGIYYLVDLETRQAQRLGIFSDFAVSPDMRTVLVSRQVTFPNRVVYLKNFILDFDPASLASASLTSSHPCIFDGGRLTRYAPDGKTIATVVKVSQGGRLMEAVQIRQAPECGKPAVDLDTFPGLRFEMDGYSGARDDPVIPEYAWDGTNLFALHGNVLRGAGELLIYNQRDGRAEAINPLGKPCCYRDFAFSPDGQYLLFSYWDVASVSVTPRLYFVPYGLLSGGATPQPLPLPFYFFSEGRPIEPAFRSPPG